MDSEAIGRLRSEAIAIEWSEALRERRFPTQSDRYKRWSSRRYKTWIRNDTQPGVVAVKETANNSRRDVFRCGMTASTEESRQGDINILINAKRT